MSVGAGRQQGCAHVTASVAHLGVSCCFEWLRWWNRNQVRRKQDFGQARVEHRHRNVFRRGRGFTSATKQGFAQVELEYGHSECAGRVRGELGRRPNVACLGGGLSTASVRSVCHNRQTMALIVRSAMCDGGIVTRAMC
jgi:hypothetical protein